MSRSNLPPDTLNRSEIQQLTIVRRDIWSSGAYGMGIGGLGGFGAYPLVTSIRRMPKSSNAWLATTLCCACVGSLVASTTTGKESAHLLHPIYRVGAKSHPNETYEEAITAAKNRDNLKKSLDDICNQQSHDMSSIKEALEICKERESLERKSNRMYRRATLSHALDVNNSGGLNDSHGGHWVGEQEENKPFS